MSADSAPLLDGEELKGRIVEFARGASTEISPHDIDTLPALAQELPPGASVYIAHTPKAALADVVRVALRAQAVGLAACPHIVARRVPDLAGLRQALRALRAGGVVQVLLVAGDLSEPLGPFASTLQLLETGCLEEAGIERAGIAGHPEGNRAIGLPALWQALSGKQAYAQRSKLRLHIVTQFSFDPGAVCAWADSLSERGIRLPVHVGIAGPTPLSKLIKFAMQCGVGASLRAVSRNLSLANKMSRPATSPDEMLVGLVRGCATGKADLIRQPHFFSFGGALATVQWLRRVREGRFSLPPADGRFQLEP